MVESLSSHKIIEAARDADEADVVACIAAVTAYMKLEEEELAAAAAKKETRETRSPWGQAALLESAQVGTGFQSVRKRLPLWRNFPGVFWIALSLAGLLSGFGAQSVSADTEYGEDYVEQDGEVIYTAQASRRAGWRPYGGPQTGPEQSGKTLIKVALVLGTSEISVDAVDGARVLDMSNGQQIAQLQPLSQWKLGSRTANGAPAIAITGRRGVDKYLIATGNQLMSGNERNVAFFPQQYIGPPALKAFENSPQMAGAAQAKPAVASLLVTCSPKPPSVQTSTQAPQTAPGAQPLPTAPRVTFGTQQAPPVAPRISFGAQPSGLLPVLPGAAQAPQVVPQSSAMATAGGDVPNSDGSDYDEAEDSAGQAVSNQPIETIFSESGKFSGITNGVIITPNPAGADNTQSVFNLNGRMYRGSLWVKPDVVKDKNGTSVTRLTAINIIDLEDYLMSVLPSEMPSSWPREALKAQAIAARSYAIANLGKYRSQGYDVKATVLDQAYRGAVAETIASNKAIAETRGIVMKHDGKVVPGFFHSSSAGHTDVAEHVWTKEVPYLKSVPDVDHKSKYVLWERKFSTPQIDNILGKDVGNVLGLFPVHRSPSGRVKNLLVIGSKGTTFVPGTTVRQLFALPSTNFNVLAYQDAYLFKGQGFGHGLGMSQYGARSLAEHGYNAAQILAYYYKDVTFEHIVDTPAL